MTGTLYTAISLIWEPSGGCPGDDRGWGSMEWVSRWGDKGWGSRGWGDRGWGDKGWGDMFPLHCLGSSTHCRRRKGWCT